MESITSPKAGTVFMNRVDHGYPGSIVANVCFRQIGDQSVTVNDFVGHIPDCVIVPCIPNSWNIVG
jgi:hypothetical protein